MSFLSVILALGAAACVAGVDTAKEDAVVQNVFLAAGCVDECTVEKGMVCVGAGCLIMAPAVISLKMVNTRTDALAAGFLSHEVAFLEHLKIIEIHRFNFSLSRIPTDLGLLTNLASLSIVDSALNSSTVPSQLGQLTNLFRLHLRGNGLQSTVPPQLAKLVGMQDLDLSGNRLYGSLPVLASLTMCKVGGNRCLLAVPCPVCCDGTAVQPTCEDTSLLPTTATSPTSSTTPNFTLPTAGPLVPPSPDNNGFVFIDEIVVFVVGAVLFLVGLVFLIVVLVRRKKQAAAARAAAPPTPSTPASSIDNYGAPPEVLRQDSDRAAVVKRVSSRRRKLEQAQGTYVPVGDAAQLHSSTPPPIIKRVSTRRRKLQEAQGNYVPVGDATQLRSSTPPPIIKRVSTRRRKLQEAQGTYVPVGGAATAPQRYIPVPGTQQLPVGGGDGHTYVAAGPPPPLVKRKSKSKRSLAASSGGSLAASSGGGGGGSTGNVLAGTRGEAWRIDSSELDMGRELGRGAYGVVREATLHGRKVAVKTLKIDGLGGQKAQAEFENEVARMASLPPHDCVVQLLGVTTIDGDMAAVVEYCASGALMDALYGKNVREFTLAQLLGFAHDAACGLAHLHRNLIVHRDIAARNVLLSGKSDLVAKIADFGMSRAGAHAGMLQTVQSTGPIMWMAPEMLSARQYAAASDVFAFGVLLYEIFARSRPWPGLKAMDVAERVLQGKHMEPPKDSAPAAVCALMVQCWAFEPAARPDITAVRKTLEDLQQD